MPGISSDSPTSSHRRRFSFGAAVLCAVCLAAPVARASDPTKETFGWLEKVVIGPGEIELDAKLDTGADTSSLHATEIRRYRRGDERYVRFRVEDPVSGKSRRFKMDLVRRATIKRHDGEHQRRPVIRLNVCLGSHFLRRIEVTLIDRSELNYPLLLGRSALQGIVVVDPEVTFTREPECGSEDRRP